MKFILKHGKVGWIAKFSADTYKQLRAKMPNASEAEIFNLIYTIYGAARATEGKPGARFWQRNLIDEESIEWRRNNPPSDLRDVVQRILSFDSEPMTFAARHPYAAFRLRMEISELIEEVLDKEIPGWRKRSHGI